MLSQKCGSSKIVRDYTCLLKKLGRLGSGAETIVYFSVVCLVKGLQTPFHVSQDLRLPPFCFPPQPGSSLGNGSKAIPLASYVMCLSSYRFLQRHAFVKLAFVVNSPMSYVVPKMWQQ